MEAVRAHTDWLPTLPASARELLERLAHGEDPFGDRRARSAEVEAVLGGYCDGSKCDALLSLPGAQSRAEKMRAIYALSLLAPDDIDEAVFQRYASLTRSDDRELRGAAVLGMSYVGWPRFCDLLAPLLADLDSTVSEDARTLLHNMKLYPARSIIPR